MPDGTLLLMPSSYVPARTVSVSPAVRHLSPDAMVCFEPEGDWACGTNCRRCRISRRNRCFREQPLENSHKAPECTKQVSSLNQSSNDLLFRKYRERRSAATFSAIAANGSIGRDARYSPERKAPKNTRVRLGNSPKTDRNSVRPYYRSVSQCTISHPASPARSAPTMAVPTAIASRLQLAGGRRLASPRRQNVSPL